jgi:hypothetical protein
MIIDNIKNKEMIVFLSSLNINQLILMFMNTQIFDVRWDISSRQWEKLIPNEELN